MKTHFDFETDGYIFQQVDERIQIRYNMNNKGDTWISKVYIVDGKELTLEEFDMIIAEEDRVKKLYKEAELVHGWDISPL